MDQEQWRFWYWLVVGLSQLVVLYRVEIIPLMHNGPISFQSVSVDNYTGGKEAILRN